MLSVRPIDTTVIHEDEFLKVVWRPRDAARVLLCFTGIGHSLGAIPVQQDEFVGTALSYGVPVFIHDKTRSWGNSFSFEQLASILEPLCGGREMSAIGNSMGGFLAVAASSLLPLRRVVAFAPQFSVNPQVLPDERRWMEYRRNIVHYRLPSLEGCFERAEQYFLFSGDTPEEERHWRHFPARANVYNFVRPGTGHDAAVLFKTDGVLSRLISDCFGEELPSAAAMCERYGLRLGSGGP